MVAASSGAVSDFTILEDVDLNEIAKTAQKISSYKEPENKYYFIKHRLNLCLMGLKIKFIFYKIFI